MNSEHFSDDLTVGQVGRHIAATNGNKVALDDGKTRLSYSELDRNVSALSGALRSLNINHGDVVSAYLPNCIEYVVTVLAVARIGAIFLPINPRFKSGELTDIVSQSKPKVVVVDQELTSYIDEAMNSSECSAQFIVCGDDPVKPNNGCLWAEALNATPVVDAVVDEWDYFSLMFTSGTTGSPKGALATHRARMLWVMKACALYSLSSNDTYLGAMPLVHSAGLTFTLMHLYVGGTVYLLGDFSAQGYIDLVEKQRITSSLVVPTMLVMVLDCINKCGRDPDLSSLQRLVTCGSPLREITKNQVLEKLSPGLYDYYGSTESNSMTVLKPVDQKRKPGSVGQPFINVRIRIVDDNKNDVEPGEVGTVLCRNPSVMTEYLNNEQATKSVFIDGWYVTGDVGYLDNEGFLYLVGRKGDVIISGGFNIYPAEIENVLMNYPGILECAVIGVEDEKWGQCVTAFVVERDGYKVDLDAVQEHCAKTLADYKKPRVLRIVDSLPKNAGGKIIKAQLV